MQGQRAGWKETFDVTDWFDRITVAGTLRRNESMAKYCSWRVGGSAERCFEPSDRDDLVRFLRVTPRNEPINVIGLGSNILVREGGLPGTVIFTSRALTALAVDPSGVLNVEAGVPCAKVAKFAAREGCGGAAFLAGIPGTIGGALAMNAGAFGNDTWSLVDCVETIDRDGQVYRRLKDEYEIGYRSVVGPRNEWFLSCSLRLRISQTNDATLHIKELISQRNASQPIGVASCGSVFKNPPGDYAGRLIDAAGLKSCRSGGCYVSEKHANFIINDGNATASDIENLIHKVKDVVANKFGVVLEPEVRILGRAKTPPLSSPVQH